MRKQARSEDTRNRILAAARICFSRAGYEATSVDDLCEEAGITKGAFYYHFNSKEALFLELQKIWFSQFEENLNRHADAGLTAADRLIELQDQISNIFQFPDNFLPLTIEFMMYAIRHKLVDKGLNEHYLYEENFTRRQIELGMADGSIQPNDPVFVARALIGMVLGQALLGSLNPQSTDWGKQIKDSVRHFLKGPQPE